ncbi:molybdopterin cofactor-binding domain-containing protein [Methylocystis sp. ATCC 49242]|uniref:xanthine dehydrogenase family protein molybdopterin-binding subunit n=1 Tax=Methylocystis sp. ATCC 49242 TaxID=622637 RepID=UPI0001F88481|nr:molybdopterin cofactor-binding domain-containing protein [Methylocystis sp. ATCC 49242]
MTKIAAIDRRRFLLGASALGGLAIGLDLSPQAQAAPEISANEVNAWVVVNPDDSVIVRVVRSDMGQGSLTGLAQLVAEELDCDWSKVSVEQPSPGESAARGRVWGDFLAGGSLSIRASQDYVRKGGAMARHMLIAAAAERWGVPAAECSAAKGVILHRNSGRSASYGKFAAAATKLPPPKEVALKDPKDWTIAGKPLKRLDTADKVTGKAVYGVDVKLPFMLNAAIRHCPVFGGRVKSYDESAIAGMPGVMRILRVGDNAVAVVANTWWRAKSALDKLPIEWDAGENAAASSETVAADLAKGLADDAPAGVGNSHGDAKAAIAAASKTLEAVYAYPYQCQATMEPMNATALYTADRCEVWAGVQDGEAALKAVIEASGLAPEKCDVHKMSIGGGFGRRTIFMDYITEAVLIAKEMPGTPVKLLWSREEDMTHGHYHPVTQCKLSAALDAAGKLSALHIRLSAPSILAEVAPAWMKNGIDQIAFQGFDAEGEAALGYDVANLLVEHAMRKTPAPMGFWRGVNINQNAIFLECFMDEIAHATGEDPLALRRRLLARAPKQRAVLDAVAQRAQWEKPAPAGLHRGLATFMANGSYVAAVAEIAVENENKVKLHRMIIATDPGHAVNPAQIERQIAGNVVFGLSALFHGEITLKDGRVEQDNFDSYESMRMKDMPKVEAIVMPSGGFWGGVGEPAIAVAAPAVLNAYFAATGKRIREAPLKRAGVQLA